MSKAADRVRFFYLCLMDALDLAVLAYSLNRVFSGGGSHGWLILAALTLLTGAFTLSIPGVNSRISLVDTFVFTNLILYGPAPATITAALGGFTSSIRFTTASRRMRATPFNMAVMSLSTYLGGEVFFKLLARGPIHQGPTVSLSRIVAPMVGLALVHYIVNAGAITLIAALDLRQSPYRVWRDNYLWTLLVTFAECSVAALISVNVGTSALAVFVIIAPILVVTGFAYKTYLDKLKEHAHHLRELSELHHRTVESLALAADAKDEVTYGHIRRVRAYALGLANLAGVTDPQELLVIETGSLLHDIGKLAVDDYILGKPGRLSAEEFEKMKTHATAGEEILGQIRFPFPVARCVRAHHERWDGSGYPDGLKGEEIPTAARILTIADTFDAFRSSRPYKLSRTKEEAVELLESESGKAFDPHLLDLFLKDVDGLIASGEEATRGMPELSFRKLSVEPAQAAPDLPVLKAGSSDSSLKELVALYEFCFGFARDLDLPDLLANVELHLRRMLPFTTCVFFLDNGDDSVRAAYVGGKFVDVLKDCKIRMGKGVSGWVAAYRKPVINTHPRLDFQGAHEELKSLSDALAVPVVDQDRGVGAISLYAERKGTYTGSHLALLQLAAQPLGALLAIATERSAEPADQEILDPTTGAYKAAFLPVAVSRMTTGAGANPLPFSLIYLRMENLFHAVPAFPPPTVATILQTAAESLVPELRDTDVLIRFGQEGFIALLPGVSGERAPYSAQRLRQQVLASLAEIRDLPSPFICLVGHATHPADGTTTWQLLLRAQRLAQTSGEPSSRVAPAGNAKKVLDFSPRA